MTQKADYVRNPIGERWIRVEGPTYRRLIKDGLFTQKHLQQLPVTRRDQPKAKNYPKLSDRASRQHLREISSLPIDQHGYSGSGRGWGKVKPKRGRERRVLYETCGRRCFFQPDSTTPGKSGYPVCRSLGKVRPKDPQCQLDCRGIQTARQYATRFDPILAQRIQLVQDNTRCK